MNRTLEKIEFVFAESDTDCDEARKQHNFMLIQNEPIKEAINQQHKNLTAPLWMCEYCAKVKESN